MRTACGWCRRLVNRLGRRGASLLFFALVYGVWAFGLFQLTPADVAASRTYRFAAALMPMWALAALWTATTGACIVQAFQRRDRIAFGLASLCSVGWAIVQLLGWLLGEVPRGYVGAALWTGFAAFVQLIAGWREHADRER